jgi:ribonuclease-3
LLEEALTHGSVFRGDESEYQCDYDRLEFLGDAVLELVIRDYLMRIYPSESEGMLTRRKASLVSAGNLTVTGRRLGLDRLVRLGSEFESSDCPGSVVADALEAVIGAVFRDGGLEEARKIVIEMLLLPTAASSSGPVGDPKSRLQEILQAAGKPVPDYLTVAEERPDHEPFFRCRVSCTGMKLGEGSGPSKRKAQQAAAGAALSRLEGDGIDGLLSF